MTAKQKDILIVVPVVAILLAVIYQGFFHRYFVLPRQDRAFLSSRPSREEVLRRFGTPTEELRAGERFIMTDWYPLPEQAATDSALCFERPYTDRIYIFFGPHGEMQHF